MFEIAVKESKGGELGNKSSNYEDDLYTSQNASDQHLMLSQC